MVLQSTVNCLLHNQTIHIIILGYIDCGIFEIYLNVENVMIQIYQLKYFHVLMYVCSLVNRLQSEQCCYDWH